MRNIARAGAALAFIAQAASCALAAPGDLPMTTAEAAPFPSAKAAEDYISRALPDATRANPNYLTKADGVETEWLTKSVRFTRAASGEIEVAMEEAYTQRNGGAVTPGTHKTLFSLAQVAISAFTEPGDQTPSGEAAKGLLFTCAKPGCVKAEWGGQPSSADKTDLYVQDDATRARILAAFLFLKGGESPG